MTIRQLKRLFMFKVAIIYTIATFLIVQGVEALVIAQWAPVWALRFSLIVTVIAFPFVMYITWVILNKKPDKKESYEDKILNRWLFILSVFGLFFVILEQIFRL